MEDKPCWITWVEPYGSGSETVYSFMKVEEVITAQKRHAYNKRKYQYSSDEEALYDFMVVHWAQFCTEPQYNNAEPPQLDLFK